MLRTHEAARDTVSASVLAKRKRTAMKVPLLDLKAQYATIRREILQAASDVLES
jgi:hypothetical protein